MKLLQAFFIVSLIAGANADAMLARIAQTNMSQRFSRVVTAYKAKINGALNANTVQTPVLNAQQPSVDELQDAQNKRATLQTSLLSAAGSAFTTAAYVGAVDPVLAIPASAFAGIMTFKYIFPKCVECLMNLDEKVVPNSATIQKQPSATFQLKSTTRKKRKPASLTKHERDQLTEELRMGAHKEIAENIKRYAHE